MTHPAEDLSRVELRKRTVDGRGIAGIRLVQIEDGPGRGQRLLQCRNAVGFMIEIAVDRGFDICSALWRGVNIGWNSANGLPWPMNSDDAEDGVGFYRNFDGFMVTCGLDHIGGARVGDASHFMHKHRKQVYYPLHGRIAGQRATISGYGIEWDCDTPQIWAEATVCQSSVFGENLLLTRRIEMNVFNGRVRIDDRVENCGFRPTPHAILYHLNFGYPFLEENVRLYGDVDDSLKQIFNAEDKCAVDDYLDYFQEFPMQSAEDVVTIGLENDTHVGCLRMGVSFSRSALPKFGIWRAFQSGVYALALEPTRPQAYEDDKSQLPICLAAGETKSYWLQFNIKD